MLCNTEIDALSLENDSIKLAIAQQFISNAIEEFNELEDYSAIIISTECIKDKLRETEYIYTRFSNREE